ncbi:MAG: hypothetical protein ACR5KV_02170 [Wolbachia sp.]
MPYGQIIIYSTTLLIIVAVFLFLKKYTEIALGKSYFSKESLKKSEKKIENLMNYIKKNKQKELMKKQEILSDKQKAMQIYKEDLKIVDIAKPVGKWTKMVMMSSGLIQRFAQLIHKEGGKKGFWELFIKTQASTKGKHKGKGR